MKALILNEFEGPLEVVTKEKPEPKEGEVLVRIKAAGINPVDAMITNGYMKDRMKHHFPLVPGWEMAGVVEECGYGARRFMNGEEVYAYARRPEVGEGTFAEYICLPESYLSKKPVNISFEEAGSVPLTGLTAYQCLFDTGKLKQEDVVLVLGASGGVGTFAIQLAKYHGSTVVAVASEDNHTYLKELGADYCIDYKNQDVEKEVKNKFKEGVDLVLDAVGGDTTEIGVQCMKKGGKIVSIANPGEDIDDQVDFTFVFVEPNSRQLDHIREIIEAGNMKVPMQKTYKLDEVKHAFEQILSGHTTGKIAFSLN
ncbi:NADP-dependent oxidoreductase [Fulvivirga sediminis]|uniref:NADP-dependent oxidoreductase n=1 Tax=Fulvivirga sediminis TaxID=2803949 RepID=A0A937K198_9BACT|nr:NADP-dependent oxidoreductase [Fulvivirga sediminis]MBL3658389.1 NADP-dependent oxidoreductase [Fulvivirga sediminis]